MRTKPVILIMALSLVAVASSKQNVWEIVEIAELCNSR
jgi:hypothetical protein